jgi:putative inorganic carbon (HCO3(-)) transporter
MKSLLFTFALTYGGSVVSLFRPYVGFLIYVCFAIIKPDMLWFWSVPEWNYSRTIALALLAGWTLNAFGKWKLGKAQPMIVCLIAYWVILLFGAVTARIQWVGWVTFEPMCKTFLPILVGISLIDSWSKLRQLAWVIVLSQGFLAYEFNILYYTTLFLPWEFAHGGLDNNGIAISMCTSIGLAFFLGMHAARWWRKLIAFACAGLMAHVVLFSNSRGGMVSLIITGIACFVLLPKTRSAYLVMLLGVLLVLRLAGEGVQDRFSTIWDSEKEGADKGGKRLEHWQACLTSMATRPLGVGPNHWPFTAPDYGLPAMAAHSTWLQVGAELGIPGLGCLLGYYLICMRRLWPYTRQKNYAPDPWARYLARMVIASLIGFIASAQFVTVDGIELPYYIALIGAGVLKVASTAEAEVETELDRWEQEMEDAMADPSLA